MALWQIDPTGLTIAQIAERSKYGESAVRTWSALLKVPFVKDGKRNLYLEPGQRLFLRFFELKSQGKTEPEILEILVEEGHDIDLPDRQKSSSGSAEMQLLLNQAVEKALVSQAGLVDQKLGEQSEVALKLAAVSYELGSRDEKIKTLEAQLQQQADQVKMLPAAVDDLERQKRQLADQLETLERQNRQKADELERAERLKAGLADDLESLERQKTSLAQELESTSASKADLAARMSTLETELQRHKTELANSQTRHEADLADRETRHKADLADRETRIQALEQELTTEKENRQAESNALRAQIQELRTSLEQKDEALAAERSRRWWQRRPKKQTEPGEPG